MSKLLVSFVCYTKSNILSNIKSSAIWWPTILPNNRIIKYWHIPLQITTGNKKGYFPNMYGYHNCPLSINPQNGQNKCPSKTIIDSKLCPRLFSILDDAGHQPMAAARISSSLTSLVHNCCQCVQRQNNSVAPPGENTENLWLFAPAWHSCREWKCHTQSSPLSENNTSSTKLEVIMYPLSSEKDQAMATRNTYRKFCEVWTCGFKVCPCADRQMYRHDHHNTLHSLLETKQWIKFRKFNLM